MKPQVALIGQGPTYWISEFEMNKWLYSATLAIAAFYFAPASATAGELCSFYQHRDFRGGVFEVYGGENIRFVGNRINDQISSVSCDPGCSTTVFEHWKYEGAAIRLRGDVAFVGQRWNDRISSIRVRCVF
jgi:hypothetical protein